MSPIIRTSFALAGAVSVAAATLCIGLTRAHAAESDPPAVVHLASLLAGDLPVNPKTGNHVKTVYAGEAGTIAAIQIGNLKRHTHETASEMFYVVDGSAQITVGDAKQTLKAGDLMIVPKGAPHSIKSDAGLLKAVLITMPPRDANDVHFME